MNLDLCGVCPFARTSFLKQEPTSQIGKNTFVGHPQIDDDLIPQLISACFPKSIIRAPTETVDGGKTISSILCKLDLDAPSCCQHSSLFSLPLQLIVVKKCLTGSIPTHSEWWERSWHRRGPGFVQSVACNTSKEPVAKCGPRIHHLTCNNPLTRLEGCAFMTARHPKTTPPPSCSENAIYFPCSRIKFPKKVDHQISFMKDGKWLRGWMPCSCSDSQW